MQRRRARSARAAPLRLVPGKCPICFPTIPVESRIHSGGGGNSGAGHWANAAIYSIYRQALSPLPVPEPEQLVNLSSPGPKSGSATTGEAGGIDYIFSYPMFKDLEKDQTVFTGLAAHCQFTANLATRGKAWIDGGSLVSGSYFPVLGVRAALGRLLSPSDDRIVGEPHIVVLSYACWQNHFGGDPNVLNRTLVINGQPMTIVGVVQREFNGTVSSRASRRPSRPPVRFGSCLRWTLYGFKWAKQQNGRLLLKMSLCRQ